MSLRRFTLFGVCFFLALLISSSVMAQVPYKVTLAPIFRPGVQLDSEGSDTRFVNVDLIVRSNIEFWAMQVNCTVNKAVLEAPIFTANTIWYNPANPVELPTTYNPATGVFSKTISLVNPSMPIGGRDQAINLGTITFQVKQLTAAATSTFVCTSSFLDRNGVAVAPTTYVAPPPLSVLTSYQISGTVTYQGRAATANAGIKVTCGSNTPVFTSANGAFVVSGRTAGTMTCIYENAADRAYLTGRSIVTVGQGGVRIPPVQLPGGNTVVNTSLPATYNDEIIENADLGVVTANFGTGTTLAQGNINGDAKTDQADVALVASNFDKTGSIEADHLLITYARDYASMANRRAFLVNNATDTLTSAITGSSKIYGAKLSPDGMRIAYVSEVTPANLTGTVPIPARYALFVAPAPGLTGAAVRLTPLNWARDAFAPSWSEDGSMLAFVCSGYENGVPDWVLNNYGNLCTISPNGQNLAIRNETSELWAPSWYGNDGVIYSDPDNGWTLTYASIRGGMNSGPLGTGNIEGNLPIWRGNTLFYVDSTGSTVMAASSGNSGDPFNLPSSGGPAANPTDPFNTNIDNLFVSEIETYEVSDATYVIFVKPYDSNAITSYNYNNDPTDPFVNYRSSLLLPQYAGAECSCFDPTADSIDYVP